MKMISAAKLAAGGIRLLVVMNLGSAETQDRYNNDKAP